MSWAEVKAINSDLSIPLNKLIGSKIGVYDQKFIDEMELGDNYYYNNYLSSSHTKSKLYDRIWNKYNNNISIIDDNTAVINGRYTYESPGGNDSYYSLLINDTIFGFMWYWSNLSNAPASERCLYMMNFKTGELHKLIEYTNLVVGSIGTPLLYKLSEYKYILDFCGYDSSKNVYKKIGLLEFNKDTTFTFTLMMDTKVSPKSSYVFSANIAYRHPYENAFYCGKYLEIISTTSNQMTSSSSYQEYRYLFDLEQKILIDSKLNSVSSYNMMDNNNSPNFFDFDKQFYIKLYDMFHFSRDCRNFYNDTSATKYYIRPTFNDRFNYKDNIFYIFYEDRYDYKITNSPGSSVNGNVGYDIYINKISTMYNADTHKIEITFSKSDKIQKSVSLMGYTNTSSYNNLIYTDINFIKFIDDDNAICIPPFFGDGKTFNNSHGNDYFYVRYRNKEYKPYFIKNITSDNPKVEYFNIPGFNNYGNSDFNSLFINSIIGLSIYYDTYTSGTTIYKCYSSLINTGVNSPGFFSNNSRNRITISNCSNIPLTLSNDSNGYYTHSINGNFMMLQSREFNGPDDFLNLLKELYLLSIRHISVIKGMKLICETSYISKIEGVKVSMDKNDNNILQVEETGVLTMYTTKSDPETNPLTITF